MDNNQYVVVDGDDDDDDQVVILVYEEFIEEDESSELKVTNSGQNKPKRKRKANTVTNTTATTTTTTVVAVDDDDNKNDDFVVLIDDDGHHQLENIESSEKKTKLNKILTAGMKKHTIAYMHALYGTVINNSTKPPTSTTSSTSTIASPETAATTAATKIKKNETPNEEPKCFKNPEKQELIKQFIESKVDGVQNYIDKTNKDPKFTELNSFLTVLRQKNADQHCNYEIPLILKMIGETEVHPTPETSNGIDFKALYNGLSELMMGNPIRDLDNETGNYLVDVFKDFHKKCTRVYENQHDELEAFLSNNNNNNNVECQQTASTDENLIINYNNINNHLSSSPSSPSRSDNPNILKTLFSNIGFNPIEIPFDVLSIRK